VLVLINGLIIITFNVILIKIITFIISISGLFTLVIIRLKSMPI